MWREITWRNTSFVDTHTQEMSSVHQNVMTFKKWVLHDVLITSLFARRYVVPTSAKTNTHSNQFLLTRTKRVHQNVLTLSLFARRYVAPTSAKKNENTLVCQLCNFIVKTIRFFFAHLSCEFLRIFWLCLSLPDATLHLPQQKKKKNEKTLVCQLCNFIVKTIRFFFAHLSCVSRNNLASS